MSEQLPTKDHSQIAEAERYSASVLKAMSEGGRVSVYSIDAAIRATCPKCNGVIRQDQTVREIQVGKVRR